MRLNKSAKRERVEMTSEEIDLLKEILAELRDLSKKIDLANTYLDQIAMK
jgi:hypothetical protein